MKKPKIYGFAYNCPCLERLDDCPIKKIDHLSFKEKVQYIDNLSQNQKNEIIEYHIKCSKGRE